VTPESEVIVERRGAAGVLTLNRPQALNALTLGMVREIAVALDRFERDASVQRIVVKGAGTRAFSAGGDVRWLYDRGQAGDYAAQSAFFAEEYCLNIRIKRYPKPYVSLIDGVVMGGGVGVSLHGSHPVAGAKAMFAMPEVGIGFFPDVGGTYLLSRLPHRIGVAMAATGLRASAADMAALGLACAYVESERLPALAEALERPGDTGAIVAEFAAPPPPSPLLAHQATLEAAFAEPELDAIRARLEADGSDYARTLAAGLAAKSPTSLEIALRQMQLGPGLTFEEAMRVEYRIVTRICRGGDFYEGVRATLIDKDNAPVWRPRPTREEIDAYFAPLGASEFDACELAIRGETP
jgi:enoyl-CoA hydratase